MKLLHIGFSNVVSMDKVVAIITPETAVAKRIREQARENNSLIDCTMGRKLRSMVLTDSPFTFLSSVRPEALLARLGESRTERGKEQEEEEDDDDDNEDEDIDKSNEEEKF